MLDRAIIPNANTVVVLDFETTGLSPDMGDRAIEIGAVRIEQGEITGRFQALMNPGRRISSFIEDYTGITNHMLKEAPLCADVMCEFADFIKDYNLVAHNASFDKRFLDAELHKISRDYTGEFACSMLVARRLYQNAPDHKLGTLIKHANIPSEGTFHRALYDSEMTTKLWVSMLDVMQEQYGITKAPFKLLQTLAKTPKNSVRRLLERS
ncbi:3'-5' exonuclease [Neptunomonas sp.]|uniref:3'-5' exonuclease n=1 Tax=Neptunomonas sp. TaxID=1971898 RepID=UPI0025FC4A76|nr:3'-5' exonuclease [Neptunomonas sp.]